jgi:nitrogen fixation protein NifU and related proteins
MQLSDLYQEVILDHYRRPRNRGKLEQPTSCTTLHNPSCGDVISIDLIVDRDGKITDVAFSGHGCSISQASASMLTVAVKGKRKEEAIQIADTFVKMMRGETGSYTHLGELLSLQGVSKYPLRVKCATLAWHAMEQAIDDTKGGSQDG